MLEIEAAFPSMTRTKEQLANHRKHIQQLGSPNAAAYLDAMIAGAGKRAKFFEKDKKLVEGPEDSPETIDKKRETRLTLIEKLSPKPENP